jgi:hypothetical protein
MDEENPHPVSRRDDLPDGQEEKVDKAGDDYAPLPPEMRAASFEAAKPKLIEDNVDASAPPEQIALPLEGDGGEEEKVDEDEDDYAPLPPEMIAASFEDEKPKLIKDNVDASVTPKQIVLPLLGHGDGEENAEASEDEYAPLPPEMRAASFKEAKPKLIEDNVATSVTPELIALQFE